VTNAPTTGFDDAATGRLVDVDSITPDQTLLADVRRTRITTPLTRVLLALIVLGGAFLAGALVERTQHKSSSSSSLDSLAAQFRNRFAGQGASGATGANGALGGLGGDNGSTIGTVKLVDGKNVYVQDLSGNVVKVTTDAATEINVTTKSAVGSLKPGTTVIVQGTPSDDGTSTAATSISQSTGLGNGTPFGGAGTVAGPSSSGSGG
jgi:hypothetical protein